MIARVGGAILASLVMVASLTLAGPSPASASVETEHKTSSSNGGVPPTALSECIGPGTTGGWDDRDQTSDGTDSSVDTLPVRPMIMRLGEPCYLDSDHINGPDWADSLAYVITDRSAPVPILDENDDGIDDGGPSGECVEAPTASGTGLLDAEFTFCNEGRMVTSYTNGGTVTNTPGTVADEIQFIVGTITAPVSSTPGSIEIEVIDEFSHNAQWKSGRLDLICEHITTGVRALGGAFSTGTYTTTSPTGLTPTINCTGMGYAPLALVSNRYISGANDRVGFIAWHASEEPETGDSGAGYYGGTQAAGARHGNVDVGTSATCSTNYAGTTGVSVHSMAGSFEIYGSVNVEEDGWWGETRAYTMDLNKSLCPFLQEISLTICSYIGFGDGEICQTHTWDADRFREMTPYPDDEDPTIDLCTEFPESPGCYEVLNPGSLDGMIVCIIEADGDFLVWLVTWVSEVPDWIACMVVPEGWDRSNLIYRTFWNSSVGESVTGFQEALPSSLGCGPIGNIDFMGEVISIDTCNADVAPGWIKSVIGWIMVLGLAVLAVRRIFWAIGGGK